MSKHSFLLSVFYSTSNTVGATFQTGAYVAVRAQFLNTGRLANTLDTNLRHQLCSVSPMTSGRPVVFSVGHIRDPAIQYIGALHHEICISNPRSFRDKGHIYSMSQSRHRPADLDEQIFQMLTTGRTCAWKRRPRPSMRRLLRFITFVAPQVSAFEQEPQKLAPNPPV
ncbi:hypothetical protein B0H19DRAFT_655325 [Mycena capillaripes]|nr:hypothetical protein B0H19DRAFT_655325 [Mycena capillaripes]